MSANNWGTCPRCKVKRSETMRALDDELAEIYGTVPIEAFDSKRSERDELAQSPYGQTLREDYEVWLDEDGRFYLSYGAYCSVCGFEHRVHEDQQVLGGDGQ